MDAARTQSCGLMENRDGKRIAESVTLPAMICDLRVSRF
jgi:hypothetical protein